MADYNATIKIIRKKAPKLDISPLEELLNKTEFSDTGEYVVSTVFSNGLSYIPKEFPDIQKAYFDLALDYFKKYLPTDSERYPLEDPESTPSRAFSGLFIVYGLLLGPTRANLGKSPVYKQTAIEVSKFCAENKDDVDMLCSAMDKLSDEYLALEEKKDADPSIVKEIWENIKQEVVKKCKNNTQ